VKIPKTENKIFYEKMFLKKNLRNPKFHSFPNPTKFFKIGSNFVSLVSFTHLHNV